MNKNLQYIKNDLSLEKTENKYIENEIYTSFINKYKDCNELFLLLCNLLFHQIINNNLACKELLAYIKLLNPNEINKNIINNIQEDDSNALHVGSLIESKKEKEDKKKFNEVLTFSNLYKIMYRKDFNIKEFNLYDNALISKYFYNSQIEYNIILFGDSISYLNRDGLLKPELYLFLIKSINDLITYDDNNEKKFLKLRGIHKSILKNAFIKNIQQIKNIINSDKVNDNDLKMIFIFIWGNNNQTKYLEEYDKIANNLMKDCLFLLSNEDKEENDDLLISGLDIFKNLIISDLELKIRIYYLKGFLPFYNKMNERKENDTEIKDINNANKDNLKNIIIEDLDKLIIPDNNA